jgi:hypothetical protein
LTLLGVTVGGIVQIASTSGPFTYWNAVSGIILALALYTVRPNEVTDNRGRWTLAAAWAFVAVIGASVFFQAGWYAACPPLPVPTPTPGSLPPAPTTCGELNRDPIRLASYFALPDGLTEAPSWFYAAIWAALVVGLRVLVFAERGCCHHWRTSAPPRGQA